MDDIERAIKDIRPSLKAVAPITYYCCWVFAVFNVAVSIPLFNVNETSFVIVGAISLQIWSTVFMVMGLTIAYSLMVNSWRLSRALMLIGVFVKSAWLMELIARTTSGKSFILVVIWATLIGLQGVIFTYFTPIGTRHVR